MAHNSGGAHSQPRKAEIIEVRISGYDPLAGTAGETSSSHWLSWVGFD
jgi:hypothetical protein